MSKIDDARDRTKTPHYTTVVAGVALERRFCDVCGISTWHTQCGNCINCHPAIFALDVMEAEDKR